MRDDEGKLKNILTESLPNKTAQLREISWAQLRKMSKDERANLKKENKLKKKDAGDKMTENMCLGVNAVTRSLEKDSLISVLIDSNVEPLIMIKHVVAMCQRKNIPVILIPFLKTTTFQKLGFAAAALGLRKLSGSPETWLFYKLHQYILNLAQRLPKPKNPLQLFYTGDDEEQEEEEIQLTAANQRPLMSFKLSTIAYLQRKSIKERVFTPPEPQKPLEIEEKFSGEFISLANDVKMEYQHEKVIEIRKRRRYINNHQQVVKISKKNLKQIVERVEKHNKKGKIGKTNEGHAEIHNVYHPLKVKRVHGNPKRLKASKTPKIKKKSIAGKA
ncbi:uncharacterized protein [Fopius arisanus]|nr:PREDICTED: uncharacterized protein LOC105272676 isoform X2 [Fopius arisanus]